MCSPSRRLTCQNCTTIFESKTLTHPFSHTNSTAILAFLTPYIQYKLHLHLRLYILIKSDLYRSYTNRQRNLTHISSFEQPIFPEIIHFLYWFYSVESLAQSKCHIILPFLYVITKNLIINSKEFTIYMILPLYFACSCDLYFLFCHRILLITRFLLNFFSSILSLTPSLGTEASQQASLVSKSQAYCWFCRAITPPSRYKYLFIYLHGEFKASAWVLRLLLC